MTSDSRPAATPTATPENLALWSAVLLAISVGSAHAGRTHDDLDPRGVQGEPLHFDISKIYPPDPQFSSEFGDDLAFAGDQLLVGAADYDQYGAVFVYELTDGQWLHVQTIDSPGEENFGSEIVIDGDRALISTNDSSHPGLWSVYVFERIGSTWTNLARLEPSTGESAFETPLALVGDLAVVGSPNRVGAAFVFELEDGRWRETGRLALESSYEVEFGSGVATDGTTIFVGAPEADPPNQIHGVVHLFERDIDGDWIAAGEITADKIKSWDSFGRALSMYGDRLAVGAEGSNLGGVDSATYVFERLAPGGPWEQVAELTPVDPAWGSFATAVLLNDDALLVGSATDGGLLYLRDELGIWGFSELLVAPDGGPLGEGFALSDERLAIGDRSDDDAGEDAGAVYLFEGPPVCDGCDHLGIDVDLDQCPGTLSLEVRGATPLTPIDLYLGFERHPSPIVGGPCDGTEIGLEQAFLLDTFTTDSAGSVTGTVDVETGACGKLVQAVDLETCIASEVVWTHVIKETVKLKASDGTTRDEFGDKVAVSGDRLVVGARGVDLGSLIEVGAAYVYERQIDGRWSETAKLVPDDPEGGERYTTVAVDGPIIGLAGNGPVLVFELDPVGGDWVQTASLEPPGFPLFYSATIALLDDTLVIGDTKAEAAAIFERDAAGNWLPVARLESPTPTDSGQFGGCVAIDGATILVSADRDIDDRGVLFVFEKGPLGNWLLAQKLVPTFQSLNQLSPTCALEGDTAARVIGSKVGERQIVIFDREPGTRGPWYETHTIQLGTSGIDLSNGFLSTLFFSVYFRRGDVSAPWVEFSHFDLSDGQFTGGNHGAVAIDGPVIAYGSDGDDDLGEDAGAVYIYDARAVGGSWQEIEHE